MKIMLIGLLLALVGLAIGFWWYWKGYAVLTAARSLTAIGWVLHRLERRKEIDKD